MAIDWGKDKIEALTTEEVKNLRNNASERNRPDIVDICTEVLASRKIRSRKHRRRCICGHVAVKQFSNCCLDLHAANNDQRLVDLKQWLQSLSAPKLNLDSMRPASADASAAQKLNTAAACQRRPAP